MAKETKVGLLVGLAFIVCFAVILANRGREEFVKAQIPDYIVEKPSADPGTRSLVGTPGPRTSTTYNSAGQAIVHVTPGRNEQPFHGSPRNGANDDPSSGHGGRGARDAADPGFRRSDEAERGDAGPDSRRADSSSTTRDLQEMLDRIAREVNARRNQGGSPAAGGPPQYPQGDQPVIRPVDPPQNPAASGRTYVVQRGDSLSKIAQKAYGSQSRSVIDRIYAANRATMSGPNDIKTGATLILPDPPAAVPAKVDDRAAAKPAEAVVRKEPADAALKPAAEPEKKTLSSAAKRWYVVRENDRFASIAREQLGDESRWREIHELNKDKFPDPNRIRPGVRIQIPAGNVVSARE